MRIFVQVWCEVDPTLNVRVDRATGQARADEGDELYRVSPLGHAGIFAACTLPGAHVTAVALGAGHTAALRHALAAGAERAVELRSERDHPVSIIALADWLREQADLVLADRAAGSIAVRLGWAHLAGLDELQVRDGMLHAIRHLGRGERELVTARLPAAVRLQSASPRTRYLARARLAMVASSAIETVTLAADAAQPIALGNLEAARPRTRAAVNAPATGSGASRLQALLKGASTSRSAQPAAAVKTPQQTPEQMADEFVRYVKHHELLPDPRTPGP